MSTTSSWQRAQLVDVCIPGGLVRGPFGGSLKKSDFVSRGYQVYEQRHAISGGSAPARYFVSAAKYAEMKRFQVQPGDFIVSCSGTIGRIARIPDRAPNGLINQALLKITVNPAVVRPEFFHHYFEWEAFQDRIVDSTQGGAMPNLVGMAIFKTTPMALPPLPEQAAIAAALDDAQTTVRALERLIAKKEAIKQGMMQRLLSGETRLPGFSGEWVRYELGQIGSFLKGHGIKRDDVRNTGVACVRYGELYTTYRDYTETTASYVSPEVAATALPIRHSDLLFAGSGETRNEIGVCVAFIGKERAVAGGDIVVMRARGVNSIYLASLANTPRIAAQKSRLGQGDAVVHISSRALASIEVELPPLDEQDAVAIVLVDADLEIRRLADRLRKAEAIRHGTMQRLLTGRARLPVLQAVA